MNVIHQTAPDVRTINSRDVSWINKQLKAALNSQHGGFLRLCFHCFRQHREPSVISLLRISQSNPTLSIQEPPRTPRPTPSPPSPFNFQALGRFFASRFVLASKPIIDLHSSVFRASLPTSYSALTLNLSIILSLSLLCLSHTYTHTHFLCLHC